MEHSPTKGLLSPRVTLNGKNIHIGVSAIVEAYQIFDNSDYNPCRLMEKLEHYSIIHDATTH